MRIQLEAFALVCLLLASCTSVCVKEQEGEPVHRDYSALRLSGDYLCNQQSTCAVAVASETSAVLTAKNASGGAQFRIEYQLSYGAPVEKKLEVLQESSFDASCTSGITDTFREETWTVPTLTLEAVSATQDGQELDLASDVLILNHKSSLLSKLVVTKWLVDVQKDEEFLGVDVTSEPGSYLRLPITRSGNTLQIGPSSH